MQHHWTRRSVNRWTALSLQRCYSFDLHAAQVRSHVAVSTQATLAALSQVDWLQAGCFGLEMPQWFETAVSRLHISSYGWQENWQQMRLTSTMELIIPRIHCATIGGHTLLVAAAHVWNTSINLDIIVEFGCFNSFLKWRYSRDAIAIVLTNLDICSTFITRFHYCMLRALVVSWLYVTLITFFFISIIITAEQLKLHLRLHLRLLVLCACEFVYFF